MSRSMHLYRPQRTDAELLEKISVAREPLVSEIVERLARWTPGASRQHYLFIGPRGIGKTHLLRLIEHRLGSNPELEARWTPIALAEDFYSITRVSDLLLEMLRILSEERDETDAEEVYRVIRYDDDDARVIDRCLDTFRRFQRRTMRGVLLMIENFDRLLERQIRDRTESHRLRKILLEEDWLITICTSPTYLNAVTNEEDPFFEFFQIHALAELTAPQQEEMLRKLAAAEGNTGFDIYLGRLRSRLRALYHFTGGNPRLTFMLYNLLSHKRVGDVRSELDLLLDQLTPFYQDRMKEISEQEAKVLEVMTLLPEGCSPAELACEARMPAKHVRATLTRLERAGYVRRGERRRKRTVYIVPERFFRIWHQMNHSRAARGRIQYLLEFFSSWYASREERDRVWAELTDAFRHGIAAGDDERLSDIAEYMSYVAAVSEGSERFERAFERLKRLIGTRYEGSIDHELSALDREHAGESAYFLYKGYFLADELGRHDAALSAFELAVELKRDDIFAQYNRAVALEKKGRTEEAMVAYRDMVALLDASEGQEGQSGPQPFLLQFLLAATDPQLVRVSAYLLGRLADSTATHDLIAILCNSDDPWRRRHCATALGLLADQEAHGALLDCLEDPAAEVRGGAATALGRIGDPSSVEPLIRVLEDSNRVSRGSAATALGRIGDPSSVEPLIRALEDPANDVRGSASTALGRIGDLSSVEPLIRALEDPASNVRGSAAAALGRIGDSSALEALIRTLEDPASNVRGSAAAALGRIGDTSAVEALIRALEDPIKEVRGSAVTALGSIGDTNAVEPLIRALEDPDEINRGSAAAALGHLAHDLTGSRIRKILHILVESSIEQLGLSNFQQVLQILLRALFRAIDLDSIRDSLFQVEEVSSHRDLWRPYEIAYEYLSSDRDPAILEQQQPEMREAVLLLVGLFEEGAKAAADKVKPRQASSRSVDEQAQKLGSTTAPASRPPPAG